MIQTVALVITPAMTQGMTVMPLIMAQAVIAQGLAVTVLMIMAPAVTILIQQPSQHK